MESNRSKIQTLRASSRWAEALDEFRDIDPDGQMAGHEEQDVAFDLVQLVLGDPDADDYNLNELVCEELRRDAGEQYYCPACDGEGTTCVCI